jgi:hypothetical protein
MIVVAVPEASWAKACWAERLNRAAEARRILRMIICLLIKRFRDQLVADLFFGWL